MVELSHPCNRFPTVAASATRTAPLIFTTNEQPSFPWNRVYIRGEGIAVKLFRSNTYMGCLKSVRIHQACIKKCQEINTNTNYIYVVKNNHCQIEDKNRTHDPFDGIESIIMHAHENKL